MEEELKEEVVDLDSAEVQQQPMMTFNSSRNRLINMVESPTQNTALMTQIGSVILTDDNSASK